MGIYKVRIESIFIDEFYIESDCEPHANTNSLRILHKRHYDPKVNPLLDSQLESVSILDSELIYIEKSEKNE